MDISYTPPTSPKASIVELPPRSPKQVIEIITIDSPPRPKMMQPIVTYTNSINLPIYHPSEIKKPKILGQNLSLKLSLSQV